MAIKLNTLAELDIPTAGTRVQVTATATPVLAAIIQADTANVGNIFVGDSNVSSTRGIALAPGAIISIDAEMAGKSAGEFILSDLWVDTATNGNDVWVSYIKVR